MSEVEPNGLILLKISAYITYAFSIAWTREQCTQCQLVITLKWLCSISKTEIKFISCKFCWRTFGFRVKNIHLWDKLRMLFNFKRKWRAYLCKKPLPKNWQGCGMVHWRLFSFKDSFLFDVPPFYRILMVIISSFPSLWKKNSMEKYMFGSK